MENILAIANHNVLYNMYMYNVALHIVDMGSGVYHFFIQEGKIATVLMTWIGQALQITAGLYNVKKYIHKLCGMDGSLTTDASYTVFGFSSNGLYIIIIIIFFIFSLFFEGLLFDSSREKSCPPTEKSYRGKRDWLRKNGMFRSKIKASLFLLFFYQN